MHFQNFLYFPFMDAVFCNKVSERYHPPWMVSLMHFFFFFFSFFLVYFLFLLHFPEKIHQYFFFLSLIVTRSPLEIFFRSQIWFRFVFHFFPHLRLRAHRKKIICFLWFIFLNRHSSLHFQIWFLLCLTLCSAQRFWQLSPFLFDRTARPIRRALSRHRRLLWQICVFWFLHSGWLNTDVLVAALFCLHLHLWIVVDNHDTATISNPVLFSHLRSWITITRSWIFSFRSMKEETKSGLLLDVLPLEQVSPSRFQIVWVIVGVKYLVSHCGSRFVVFGYGLISD